MFERALLTSSRRSSETISEVEGDEPPVPELQGTAGV